MILRHRSTGRSLRAAVVLLAVWSALAALWLAFDASPVWLSLGAMATLPALYDFVTARVSGLDLDTQCLRWFSGRHSADVVLTAIDHARFDTRLDFSVRVTVILRNGARLRLPQAALPPPDALKSAFDQAGVRTQTHHFNLLS